MDKAKFLIIIRSIVVLTIFILLTSCDGGGGGNRATEKALFASIISDGNFGEASGTTSTILSKTITGVSSGACIVVAVEAKESGTASTFAVTDGSITLLPATTLIRYDNNNAPMQLFYEANASSGSHTLTLTVTPNGGTLSFTYIGASSFKGVSTTAPFDGGSAVNGGGMGISSRNVNTSNPNDLIVGYLDITTESPSSVMSGFISLVAGDVGGWMGYKTVSSTGSYSATASCIQSTLTYPIWGACCAAFKAAYAGPTLTSATISSTGTSISLVFSESVTFGSGGNGGWSANFLYAGATTMTYSSGSGTNTLVYNLNNTIQSGETGTISYNNASGVEDGSGNNLQTISTSSQITNNSTVATTGIIYDNNFANAYAVGRSTPPSSTPSVTINNVSSGGLIVLLIETSELNTGNATDTFTAYDNTQATALTATTSAPATSESGTTTSQIFYLANAQAGTHNITLTITHSSTDGDNLLSTLIDAISFRNISTSSPLDGASVGSVTYGSTESISSGSITTTNKNDVLVGWIENDEGVMVNTMPGFTLVDNVDTVGGVFGFMIVASTGSYATTATLTSSGNSWNALIAGFENLTESSP